MVRLLKDRRVVVGVCGSIAAYKACEVVSALRQAEADVRVVMTEHATKFVGVASLRALSGHDVAWRMFDDSPETEIEHISLAEFAEVLVVVGATANVLGKVCAGICDDLLTTTICACRGKVLFAPAMNWRMWENPITQRNVRFLTQAGYIFVGPDCGYLACGESGAGRLASTEDILDAIDQALGPADSRLRGKRVLVTCGPTREWLDPVRFISNPSTGKMGFALAQEAMAREARVTVVVGPTSERAPWGAEVVKVETTANLLDAVLARVDGCDIVVGAAAPVDFTPRDRAPEKIKKSSGPRCWELELTPDVMGTIGSHKGDRLHIGFAAETSELEANAARKLQEKNLDLVVANDVTSTGVGFGADANEVVILSRVGTVQRVPQCSKRQVAVAVWDQVERLIAQSG